MAKKFTQKQIIQIAEAFDDIEFIGLCEDIFNTMEFYDHDTEQTFYFLKINPIEKLIQRILKARTTSAKISGQLETQRAIRNALGIGNSSCLIFPDASKSDQ